VGTPTSISPAGCTAKVVIQGPTVSVHVVSDAQMSQPSPQPGEALPASPTPALPAPTPALAAPSLAPSSTLAVLDTFPTVAPLLESGVAGLSRSVLAVLGSQVECSTAELQALGRATTLTAAQYAEVQDGAGELTAFFAAHSALAASLAPHLQLVEDIEKCAAGLEEAAKELDEQTKVLESAFAELL
jgi:hypothetical protein